MDNRGRLLALVETLLLGPPFPDLDGIHPIKAKGKGAFFLTADPLNEGRVFIKLYRRGGLLGRFIQSLYLGKGRFRKEYETLLKLKRLGFNVPEPLGIFTKRAFGPFYKGALLSRYIEGSVTLPSILPNVQDDDLLAEIACMLARLHDAGIEHKDLNLNNFLLTKDGAKGKNFSVIILDFDKAKTHRRPLCVLRRAYGLIRMERSAKKMFGEEFAGTFFARLCSAYSKKLNPSKRRQLKRALSFMRPILRLRYKLSDMLHV